MRGAVGVGAVRGEGVGVGVVVVCPREWARAIENISRIRMDVARDPPSILLLNMGGGNNEFFNIFHEKITLKKGGNLASGVR